MTVLVANNAWGTLTVGVQAYEQSLVLDPGQGDRFPAIGANTQGVAKDFFYATLVSEQNELEIVKCTLRNGETLTVLRGQDGTTPKFFPAGSRLELRPCAALFNAKADYEDVQKTLDGFSETIKEMEKTLNTPKDSEKDSFRQAYDVPALSQGNNFTGNNTYTGQNTYSGKSKFTGDVEAVEASFSGDVDARNLTVAEKIISGAGGGIKHASPLQKGVDPSADSVAAINVWDSKGVEEVNRLAVIEHKVTATGDSKMTIGAVKAEADSTDQGEIWVMTAKNGTKTGGCNGAWQSTEFRVSSDKRLKHDFQDVENVSEKLRSLKCYDYRRLDMDGRFYGLIAQEVEKVFPYAVKYDMYGYLTVDPYALVSLLLEGYKDLLARVEKLESAKAKRPARKGAENA